jgi:hypothetical protein
MLSPFVLLLTYLAMHVTQRCQFCNSLLFVW